MNSIDLSLPGTLSINRLAPTWTTDLLNSYIATIDAFAKYDNVLAYNVGNEAIISANQTGTAAFLKAAARDTKAYLCVTLFPSLWSASAELTPFLVSYDS